MREKGIMAERLLGILILGLVLFSYPILTVFDLKILVGGVPLLYLYVFIAWFTIIVFIYSFATKKKHVKDTKISESTLFPPPEQ